MGCKALGVRGFGEILKIGDWFFDTISQQQDCGVGEALRRRDDRACEIK